MTPRGGNARWGTVSVTLAVLLASCAFGVTMPATNVTDSGAILKGAVHNTITGPTEYWFEYGRGSGFGSSTAHRSINVTDTSRGYRVTAPVGGLRAGNEYHSRLCALDAEGEGACGDDQVFTTLGDSVTGNGIVFSIPQLGFAIAATIDASSKADGSKATGTARFSPGSFDFRFPDQGPVTCLRIDGHRATIGFVAQPLDFGDPDAQPIPELLFVEDNGETGDRLGMRTLGAPATTCPAATDADFPYFFIGGGIPIDPVLQTGNFVVHDDAG